MSDNVVGKLERRRHWVWQQAGWHEEALRLRHLFPRMLFHVTCNLKTMFNFEAGLLLALLPPQRYDLRICLNSIKHPSHSHS